MAARSATGVAPSDAPDFDMKAALVSMKQERILEAATRLFLQVGYHGTSMDAIAQAIGVTKPFIYYQFKDKGEILAAICSAGAELSSQALSAAEAQKPSAESRMRWFCLRLTEVVVDRGHFLAVYLRETANLTEDDRKTILAKRADIDRRVARLIEAGTKAGEFAVEDPHIAARAITGMISNSFQWHRKSDAPQADRFAEIMTDIAMRTLVPQPPKRVRVARAKPGR